MLVEQFPQIEFLNVLLDNIKELTENYYWATLVQMLESIALHFRIQLIV